MKNYTAKTVKLEQLILDKENPRFAELYNGSSEESDIIEYLLFTESANEVAEAISIAEEFYADRPLWVYKSDGEYIVKDGNRRCAAVKALQVPNKYELNLPRFEFKDLPVLEYHNLADLNTRIRLEHNSNLFKKWGRIAKALEIYRLFSSGNSLSSLTEIDSKPKDFIKTATFYHKAAEIKGEEFKKLVRDGRGKTGGKTIVFERLFRVRKKCGYNFKRKTSEIMIKDEALFLSYINALVPYLIEKPETTSRLIDEIGTDKFIENLKPYGFPPEEKINVADNNTANNELEETSEKVSQENTTNINEVHEQSVSDETKTNTNSRKSIKNKPSYKRKRIPSALEKLINECYNLGEENFPNAKTALSRVVFECTLKYVIENTMKANGKALKTSNHFQKAFYHKGKPLKYTNFDVLKSKFTELIIDTGIRSAFEDFDLQRPHQIIHNYRVGAIPADAKGLCDNLIDLLEYLLQEESKLLSSLDTSKI